jgi:hypothetical protein
VGFFRRLFGRDDGDADAGESPRGAISKEEALGAYIVREHKLGRDVNEILEDPYLKNRTTEEQRLRLLERPEVIRAIGEDVAAMARERAKS